MTNTPWLSRIVRRCATGNVRIAAAGLGVFVMTQVAVPGTWAATLTLAGSQPLVAGVAVAPPPWPVGKQWTLDARGLRGPAPLACPNARQQILLVPAQGLFQGAWSAEGADAATKRAADVGLKGAETVTLRLDCANASFDLHRVAPRRWLTALDGRVLLLRQGPDAEDPLAPVRELLLQHLSALGSPFDAARVERLRPWLAPSLSEAFRRWFGRPARPDEAPQLNGDPFTDTQEPPLALALGERRRHGALATQVVLVDVGGGRQHRLTYRLQRADDGAWRINDIDYGEGVSLRQLIRKDLQP